MENGLEDGVESVLLSYYSHIDNSKIKFDFIIDEDSTCEIPYKKIEEMGSRVILCPSYKKVFKYMKFLENLFKENKYNIIHSNINTLSIFPLKAAKKAGIPIRIAHSHSTSNKKEWKKNLLKNILKPFSKKYANTYFACSEFAGRYLFGDKTFDNGEVTVINNAISIDKFKFDEQLRKKKRKELGIKDNQLLIGHIGRFVEQKNHRFLIDIFNEIYKQNKNAILLLVGQGPLVDEIKEKVKDLGLKNNVKFLGQRKDANELYQAMDIFCLPSLYEGLPVVGVEAQANGLLCILSDEMTKETKILKSTKFLSINESPKTWADVIFKEYKGFKRKDVLNEIKENGFDITTEAKKLEKIMEKLYKKKDKID